MNNSTLFKTILSQSWYMRPEAMRTVLDVVSRRGDNTPYQAISDDNPMGYERLMSIDNGNAIINIEGPLVPKANLLTEMSGATSTEQVGLAIEDAITNPDIEQVVLSIDSPGGAAKGINELADMIYESRDVKPIVAYIDGEAASAGYFLASAASYIVASETSVVGNIGTVLEITDTTNKEENEGVYTYEIAQPDNKRPDVTTEEGYSKYQYIVDKNTEIFNQKVARNRGMTEKEVLENADYGWVLIGEDAVAGGLVDEIGTLPQILNGNYRYTTSNKSTSTNYGDNVMTDTQNQNQDETQNTAQAENERIKGVLDKADGLDIDQDFVNKLAFDGETTPTQAAEKFLDYAKEKQARDASIENLAVEHQSTDVVESESNTEPQTYEDQWHASADLQSRFPFGPESYAHYMANTQQ